MSTKSKDMRRPDLVIPYVEPPKDDGASGDVASSLSTMMPMATILTKNKMIGWAGFILALQGWLAETPDQRSSSSTPGYFAVGMATMALLTVRDGRRSSVIIEPCTDPRCSPMFNCSCHRFPAKVHQQQHLHSTAMTNLHIIRIARQLSHMTGVLYSGLATNILQAVFRVWTVCQLPRLTVALCTRWCYRATGTQDWMQCSSGDVFSKTNTRKHIESSIMFNLTQ